MLGEFRFNRIRNGYGHHRRLRRRPGDRPRRSAQYPARSQNHLLTAARENSSREAPQGASRFLLSDESAQTTVIRFRNRRASNLRFAQIAFTKSSLAKSPIGANCPAPCELYPCVFFLLRRALSNEALSLSKMYIVYLLDIILI